MRTSGTWTARRTTTPRNASPMRARQLHCARRSSHRGTIEVDSAGAPVTSIVDDVDKGTRHGVSEGDDRDGKEQANEPSDRRPDREGDQHSSPGHPDRPPKDPRSDDGGLEDVDQNDRDEDGAGGSQAT